jgi:hypothetical protein
MAGRLPVYNAFVSSTILLEDDVRVDPRKYGPLVAPALGVTLLEAKLAVRKGRGIFLEGVDDAHAARIAAALAEDGIRAHVVSKEQAPVLPPLRKIASLEHGEELLGYRTPEGDAEALPWDAIFVASCGVVAKEVFREFLGHVPFHMIPPLHKLEGQEKDVVRENLLLKMNAPAPDTELARVRSRKPESPFEEIDRKYGPKVRVYLDLLTADLGTWLRVPMEEIGYVYMEGGIRMGGAWGFQLLVNDVRDKAGAAFTDSALRLLESSDIKELIHPQVEEFTRLTAWTALKRSLWPNAASSSPSPELPAPPTDAGSSSASPAAEPPSTSS